jgi:hypothetical protein
MKLMLPLAVIGLLVAAGVAFAADEQAGPADTGLTRGAESLPSRSLIPDTVKKPYARLFGAQDLTDQEKLRARVAAELLRADPSRTDVICGLTMRYVDERNDPRIIVHQQDQTVDAKIRRIVPDVCRKEPGDGTARTTR